MTVTAVVLEQVSFRARGDSVGLNVDTWDHALNANFSQEVDQPFRVRFCVAETNNGMANNVAYSLQYNLGGAGFVAIGDTAAVRSSLSGQFEHLDPTEQRISTGSFVAGVGVEATTTTNISLQSSRTEIEWCLELDPAQVDPDDTIVLRVVQGTSTVLNTYTNSPTITATAASQIPVDETLVRGTGEGDGRQLSSDVGVAGEATLALGQGEGSGRVLEPFIPAPVDEELELGGAQTTGALLSVEITARLRPTIDLQDGGWTNEVGGTELSASIGEVAPNDATFIRSSNFPSEDIARFELNQQAIDIDQPVTIRVRYWKEGAGERSLTVRLIEGAQLIAERVQSDIPEGMTEVALILTEPERALITNGSPLILEVEAN